MKFNLGDRIVGKKTGQLIASTIFAVFSPKEWVDGRSKESFNRWNDLYPDWDSKPIYLSRFDKPERTITFEEYKNGVLEYTGKEIDKVAYELYCPKNINVAYPEDDVEVI